MSFLDQAKDYIPSWLTLHGLGTFVIYAVITILILLVVGGAVGAWAYWYVTNKKYSKSIKIFEKVDGRPKLTVNTKAMEMKIGQGGDTIFHIKSLNKYQARPSIQSGDNSYWFARREDGELINIGMEDFDLKMREMKIYFLENEQRYARASLQKLSKDRFEKEGFWKKYGNMILSIVFIVVVSTFLLLISGKMMSIMGSVDATMKEIPQIMDKLSQILGAMDNVCSNSGVVKA